MKTTIKLFTGLLLMIFVTPAFAQDMSKMSDGTKDKMETMDLAGAMSQIADGIKPEAIKGNFDLNGWKEKLSTLNVKSFDGVKAQLSSLVGGIKDAAFLKGAQKDFLGNLKNMKGLDDAPQLLGGLLNGLKPDMLTDKLLKNKDGLMKSLDMLK